MGKKTLKKPENKEPTIDDLKAENAQLKKAVQMLQGAMQKAKDMSFFMQEQFYDRMTRGAGQ